MCSTKKQSRGFSRRDRWSIAIIGAIVVFNLIFTIEREKEVVVTDETSIGSFLETVDAQQFREGLLGDVKIEVTYRSSGILESMERKGIEADRIIIQETLVDTISLADHTKVGVWEGVFRTEYRLEDETVLLNVMEASGPENVFVGGIDNLDDLSQEVQERIKGYYEEMGVLYDVEEDLQYAYDSYRQLADKDEFEGYLLQQDVRPIASNQAIIYFQTEVIVSRGKDATQQILIGTAFNRETGELVENTQLFAYPEEELVEKLLEIAKIKGQAEKEYFQTHFNPENIVIGSNSMQIFFEDKGELEENKARIIVFDYTDELKGIMHEWVIPEQIVE